MRKHTDKKELGEEVVPRWEGEDEEAPTVYSDAIPPGVSYSESGKAERAARIAAANAAAKVAYESWRP